MNINITLKLYLTKSMCIKDYILPNRILSDGTEKIEVKIHVRSLFNRRYIMSNYNERVNFREIRKL